MTKATFRVCIPIAVAASVLCVAAATAITFNEPGYAQHIVASIPGSQSNHFGGVVGGLDGNAYVVGGFRADAFRITPAGSVTVLTVGAASNLLGVGLIGSTLYVGQDSGRIDTLNIALPSPAPTLLTTVPGDLHGNGNADFAVAPAGFGAFGGQLISCNGGVYAVNPTTGVKTDIVVETSNHYSALDFGPNGVLYVADYENARVITVTATGTIAVFASLPGTAPDGLAVHPGTGNIYVADSSNSAILKITPAGVSNTFATDTPLDSGYFPSGLAFSADGGTLYYLTNEGSFQLAAITGFPASMANAIPVLGLAGLLALAALIAVVGAVVVRRALA
jgi:DNA-binding beta-propeller fold protein YncE